MTQEQKAKRYDEALEKARQLCSYPTSKPFVSDLQDLFPELKESEDEKIRKELISFLQLHHPQFVGERNQEKWIAWLEKQGEQKHKFIIGDIISNNNVIYRVDNIVKNCIGQDCYFLVNIEREKRGTRYLIMRDSEGKTSHMGEITWLCDQVDAKFEKQGEKLTDKVQPKFHKGDWISGYYTNYRVTAINSKGYVVEDTDGNKINILFENEKFHHLWAIQDAKAGDVLATKDGRPFIFKDCSDIAHPDAPVAYCGINGCDHFYISAGSWWTDGKVYPATKEQCELLLKKMKEAGYEWDTEKKELKKIEQKSAKWSEEDEVIYAELIKFFEAMLNCLATEERHNENRKWLNWLKSLKQRIGG